jgi:hypothetical protein
MKKVLVVGLFAAFVLLGALASACGTTKESTPAAETVTETVTATQPAPAETETQPAESAESSGQRNARESAESYLATQAFSRKGLIQQLKYEGFSKKDAVYAVDAINVDWNKEAVKSARDYLDTQSFSRSGLIEQLEYEGFTPAQAKYGVKKAY